MLFHIAYPLSAIMLIVWAVVTFAYDGPGWIHFFLSLGVFLLIWRIVAGGTQDSVAQVSVRTVGRRAS